MIDLQSDKCEPRRQFTITTADERGLHCRTWADDQCKYVLIVVHGLGEHSGCYDEFGSVMCERGIGVYAFDLHGHGKSPGVRGHAPSLDTLVDDIEAVCNYVSEQHNRDDSGVQVSILGHSMGGHLVLRYVLDQDRCNVARAIVTNPMILPDNPPTKAQSFAAWLTSKVIPRVRMSADIDPSDLTQDEDVLVKLGRDPLMHEQLSIGIGGELMSSGHQLVENANELSIPLLVLRGGDDDLCDVETTDAFCDAAGTLCDSHTFDGLRHSLLLEKEREQVFDSIQQWLLKK
ncbi:alpha/beta hydrolase [Roseiconus lacunae]|uniref:Alpha/beta hydrolase n=1 Tax=Roseiconus lacunae TaxID=2605694 RepID=A0ABT7PC34_9BACT|nr:alpha/beta hydrolase [Roseiconus lacunae]MDM4014047.1 alpha/beta hydrolase [Roseiconus lacunae]